jgi:hypothetical protein
MEIASGKAPKAMSRKTEMQLTAKRSPITRAALESAIAEAVRGSNSDCSGLVGVIVERVVPRQPGGANWALKGVRYGRAKRDRCRAAIAVCVEDGQSQFEISD